MATYRIARRRRRRLWLLSVALVGAGAALHVVVVLAGGLILALGLAATRARDIDRWRRGAVGEAATASLLTRLPERRWKVWHDVPVPGSRANLDHVVIGPSGVWVVDTKTTVAPVRFGWRKVYLGQRQLDTSATRWEAEVVEERLGFPVKPVVAIHGTGPRRRGARSGGVLVVRADRLVRRLKRGRRRLNRFEVDSLAATFTERFGPRA
jgi:hypothetical protein